MATNDRAERQSDLAVMEALEYNQKSRLKAILNAHDNVEEKAKEAWDLYVAGEISHDAKNIMIQRAVKAAIRESYKLLADHERTVAADDARDSDHSEYWVGAAERGPLGVIPQESRDDIAIYGLRHFLDTKEFYEETVVTRTTPRNKPPTTETYTTEQSVPEEVSWAAFLRLKEFLDDVHDLEISFEELDDKLADEEPETVQLADGLDMSQIETLEDFDGPVDARAVIENDD